MHTVAALYCLPDERCVYRTLEGVEVWDEARDARTFPGGMPVVAHPPCRTWGRLAQFSKGTADEHALGFLAVAQVRANGGVLEYPAGSTLWRDAGLPIPGAPADAGGGVQHRSASVGLRPPVREADVVVHRWRRSKRPAAAPVANGGADDAGSPEHAPAPERRGQGPLPAQVATQRDSP